MRHLCFALSIVLMNLGVGSALAGEGCCKPQGSCERPCEPCRRFVCRPYMSLETVTKTCFETECKQICIPKVTFPWQERCAADRCGRSCGDVSTSCVPKCGKVVTVNTLKVRDYQCERWVCRWEIEETCCTGDCKPLGCDANAPRSCTQHE